MRILLGHIPKSAIANFMIYPSSTYWLLPKFFTKHLYQFTLPPEVCKSSCFCLSVVAVSGIFIFASLLGANCIITVVIWLSWLLERLNITLYVLVLGFSLLWLAYYFFCLYFLLGCFTFLWIWNYLCVQDINVNMFLVFDL